MEISIEKTMARLERNNMEPYFVQNSKEAVELIKKLVPENSTVGFGGSVTLKETGVLDLLKNGNYNLLDRSKPGLTTAEIDEIQRKIFFADVFFTSSNAVTQKGELYNVDGRANRTAALLFGPKSVIVVVGINKLVPDLDEAVERVRTIAAPKNTVRLNCKTYCHDEGQCVAMLEDGCRLSKGCGSSDRICCNYVISAKQRDKGRIKVIIVNEELGY